MESEQEGSISPEPVDVLYILGPGHCGSTLLNLCLDRSSSVIGVSEIVTLNRRKPGWSGDENALTHPFWEHVDANLRGQSGLTLSEVPFNLRAVRANSLPGALEQNYAAFRSVLSVSGKRIVADASKSPERLSALMGSPLFRVQVIYLVRDGRAVVHAYRRKYGAWRRGYFKLIRVDRAARNMVAQCGGRNWLTIRYEDMAAHLDATLRRICDFSGIEFEERMLSPDTATFKGLGGNRLRKRPVEPITPDIAWESEMPRIVRNLTAVAVHGFNRRNGYAE